MVFLEGVYLDRTEASLKPRFVKGEPPTDVDIATVVQKISHRVIRKLRHLGYLEAGLDAVVADPPLIAPARVHQAAFQFARDQKILPRQVSPEEMFASNTLDLE